ncbi:S49 family peptidase [Nannocystaceae bacterium ST9]
MGLAALTLALLPSFARAQDPIVEHRELHDGVDRPITDLSGSGDSSSLELNPAMINGVAGLDVTLLGYQTTYQFARGSGFGAFVSANLGWGFALGLGIQALEPSLRGSTFDYDAAHNRPATKLSFALALGRGEWGSFGIGVHGIHSGGTILRTPQVDLGGVIRMTNYASLGLVGRMAPASLRDSNFRSTLDLAGELALRPLGNHWFELAGGLTSRVDQSAGRGFGNFDTDDLLPYGRVALRYQGVELAGQVERVQADRIDQDTLALLGTTTAVRGSVALSVAWDFAMVGVGMHAGLGPGVDGVAYKARFSSQKQGRVYWGRRVDAEKLVLAKIGDQRTLIAALRRIERAERAGERTVLVVEADGFGMSWGAGQELRDALRRVRDAGGHVFAWVESPSLRDYWLASVAEKIYTHPAGEFDTVGIASRRLYFKDALAKLGVSVEAIHIEEYKSAHENFTRSDRSEFDAEQREALLDDTWTTVVHDIAQARGLSKSEVRALVDEAPLGPARAVEATLADEVMHRDELVEQLSEDLGVDVQFASFERNDPAQDTWSVEPYVAVVLIEGTMVDGKSRYIPLLDIVMTGSDTTVATLQDLRKDPACRGIVLRVDSGGGSAFASELIWREVQLTHEAWQKDPRKSPPIVVSMSDVAASGGYYVAMGTDLIFAEPLTVTGSIGVVIMHFDVSGLLDMLGVTVDRLERGGEGVEMNTIWQPWSDEQRSKVRAGIERTYDLFLERVSAARGKPKPEIDAIARGRVWSGERAKSKGLIDRHGGLREAIAELDKRSGRKRFGELELRVLPVRLTLLQLILRGAGSLIVDPVADLVAERGEAKQAKLPLAVEQALARVNLSLLYLPQDQAATLVSGELVVE